MKINQLKDFIKSNQDRLSQNATGEHSLLDLLSEPGVASKLQMLFDSFAEHLSQYPLSQAELFEKLVEKLQTLFPDLSEAAIELLAQAIAHALEIEFPDFVFNADDLDIDSDWTNPANEPAETDDGDTTPVVLLSKDDANRDNNKKTDPVDKDDDDVQVDDDNDDNTNDNDQTDGDNDDETDGGDTTKAVDKDDKTGGGDGGNTTTGGGEGTGGKGTDGEGTGGEDTDGEGTGGEGTDGEGTGGEGTGGKGTDGEGTDGEGTGGKGTDGEGTDGEGTGGEGTGDGDGTDGGDTTKAVDKDDKTGGGDGGNTTTGGGDGGNTTTGGGDGGNTTTGGGDGGNTTTGGGDGGNTTTGGGDGGNTTTGGGDGGNTTTGGGDGGNNTTGGGDGGNTTTGGGDGGNTTTGGGDGGNTTTGGGDGGNTTTGGGDGGNTTTGGGDGGNTTTGGGDGGNTTTGGGDGGNTTTGGGDGGNTTTGGGDGGNTTTGGGDGGNTTTGGGDGGNTTTGGGDGGNTTTGGGDGGNTTTGGGDGGNTTTGGGDGDGGNTTTGGGDGGNTTTGGGDGGNTTTGGGDGGNTTTGGGDGGNTTTGGGDGDGGNTTTGGGDGGNTTTGGGDTTNPIDSNSQKQGETLIGTENSDVLIGGDYNDTIEGKGGDDYIEGGDGDDIIEGGFGKDWLDGGAGENTIYVADGGKEIIYHDIANQGHDIISTKSSGFDLEPALNDNVLVIQGDESILFSENSDGKLILNKNIKFVVSDDNPNTLIIKNGEQSIITIENYFEYGAPIKTIEFVKNQDQQKPEDVSLGLKIEAPDEYFTDITELTNTELTPIKQGTQDNDALFGSHGHDHIYGGDGDDFIVSSVGDDIVEGGDGNDTIFLGADSKTDGQNIAYGGAGNDDIQGGFGNDQIFGGVGNDILEGGIGDDYLVGGEGVDVLEGMQGDDELVSGTGDDWLLGGKGENTIFVDKQGTNTIFNKLDDKGHDIIAYDPNDAMDSSGPKNILEIFGTGILVKNAEGKFSLHSDMTFQQVNQNDLIIYNGGEKVATVKGYFTDKNPIKTIKFISEEGVLDVEIPEDETHFKNHDELVDSLKTIIYGTDGDDKLSGFSGEEIIYGKAGNDILEGLDGNDELYGQAGNDTLKGGKGDDILYGSYGYDTLIGGSGDDIIYGGSGDDLLVGNQGDDTIYSGRGSDTIIAGSGENTIYVSSADENLIKHKSWIGGHDIISYGPQAAPSNGANNKVQILTHLDELLLRDGVGQLKFNENVQFVADEQNDSALNIMLDGRKMVTIKDYFSDDNPVREIEIILTPDTALKASDRTMGIEVVLPTDKAHFSNPDEMNEYFKQIPINRDGDDHLIGTAEEDVIYGGKGNDIIEGLESNDTLYGETGDDAIDGGAGQDKIYGGAGIDEIVGGAGNDEIYGGADNDILEGGIGDDHLDGGEESDILLGMEDNDVLVSGTGDDWLLGGKGKNKIFVDKQGTNKITNNLIDKGHDIIAYDPNDATASSGPKNILEILGSGIIVKNAGGKLSLHSDMTFQQVNQNDLIIYNGGEKVATVKGYFTNQNPIKTIKFSSEEGELDVEIPKNKTHFNNHDELIESLKTIIYGTDGDDKLSGFNGEEIIYGKAGDDILEGLEGNDNLYGQAGNDTLKGGSGDDKLYGGHGDDTLIGHSGDDTIYSGKGNDTIIAGSGKNTIYVDSEGENLIKHKSWISGHDIIAYGSQAEQGNSGNNKVQILTHFDELLLRDGAGQLKFNENVQFVADNKDDSALNIMLDGRKMVTIKDYFSNDNPVREIEIILTPDTVLTASDRTMGIEVVLPTDKNNFANPTEMKNHFQPIWINRDGDDHLIGTAEKDVIYGGKGNDTIEGLNSNDTLYGEEGDDTIHGGYGNDEIRGGKGKDTIEGGYGWDEIYGGDSGDIIKGGMGKDKLYGGRDNDTLYGGEHDDILKGGDGDDVLYSGAGSDEVYGGDGDDYIDESKDAGSSSRNDINILSGEAGDDKIYGSVGRDYLYGGDGDDLLFGRGGTNIQDGGAGNDTIISYYEDSRDIIFGGSGDDTIDNVLGDSYIEGGSGNNTINLNLTSEDVIKHKLSEQGHDTIQYKEMTSTDKVSTKYEGPKKTIVIQGSQNELFHKDGNGNMSLNPNITFVENGNNLIIKNKDKPIMTVKGYFGEKNLIKEIQFMVNEGETIDLSKPTPAPNTIILNQPPKAGDVLIDPNETDVVGLSIKVPTNKGHFDNLNALNLAQQSGQSHILKDGETKILGSTQADLIKGSGYDDVIQAGAGNDTVHGLLGDDTILGGAGDDVIYGNAGKDIIKGGSGDNTILLDKLEANVVYHDLNEGGHDTISFDGYPTSSTGPKNTLVIQGDFSELFTKNPDGTLTLSNNVTFTYHTQTNTSLHIKVGGKQVIEIKNFFNDKNPIKHIEFVQNGDDQIKQEEYDSLGVKISVPDGKKHFDIGEIPSHGSAVQVEQMGVNKATLNKKINGWDMNLEGTTADDHIDAGRGDNVIDGKLGDDIILDGSGSSRITGGEGDDILVGGGGNDTFVFEGKFGNDIIRDATGNTTLEFHGYSADEIKLLKGESNDLIIQIQDNQVTFEHFFDQVPEMDHNELFNSNNDGNRIFIDLKDDPAGGDKRYFLNEVVNDTYFEDSDYISHSLQEFQKAHGGDDNSGGLIV